MQVTYFLTGPMFNLLFYCHIISYWEKVPPYEKSKVQFIPLKSKLSGKFQCFNAIDASIEMLKNSCVFQLKWKNAKHFTRLKQRAALSRLISFISLPRDKTFLQRYTVYRNIQTFGFKVLQECSSWASRKGKCKYHFSDHKQKHDCLKICKVREVFDCVSGAYSIFNDRWLEVCKMN